MAASTLAAVRPTALRHTVAYMHLTCTLRALSVTTLLTRNSVPCILCVPVCRGVSRQELPVHRALPPRQLPQPLRQGRVHPLGGVQGRRGQATATRHDTRHVGRSRGCAPDLHRLLSVCLEVYSEVERPLRVWRGALPVAARLSFMRQRWPCALRVSAVVARSRRSLGGG